MPLDIAHYYKAFVEYETNFKGQVKKIGGMLEKDRLLLL